MYYRTWPTHARQQLETAASLTVVDEVPLALRAHRQMLGLSQREYAALRGWSKSHAGRLESDPGRFSLAQLMDALVDTGFELVLVPSQEEQEQNAVEQPSWPASELVALDSAGRRFPAHVWARRVQFPRDHYRLNVGNPYRPSPLWAWWRSQRSAFWSQDGRAEGE